MDTNKHSSDGIAKLIFKHVVGIAIGSVVGAVGFATAAHLGLTTKLASSPKQAAALGAVLVGLSTLGTGNILYDVTIGKLEPNNPSFASRLHRERMQMNETPAISR